MSEVGWGSLQTIADHVRRIFVLSTVPNTLAAAVGGVDGVYVVATPITDRSKLVGQPLLTTKSWHIATIPGVLIVIVVTGFNALGDGVRDAIDTETTLENEEEATTAASGAGG